MTEDKTMPEQQCNAPADENAGLVFPCTIDVKIFIQNQQEIEQQVRAFVTSHLGQDDVGEWKTRQSSGDKYLAITVMVNAHSRAHIDGLYQALCDHEQVIMAI